MQKPQNKSPVFYKLLELRETSLLVEFLRHNRKCERWDMCVCVCVLTLCGPCWLLPLVWSHCNHCLQSVSLLFCQSLRAAALGSRRPAEWPPLRRRHLWNISLERRLFSFPPSTLKRVWVKNTKGSWTRNAHANHRWVDETWCIFGWMMLGKWKTFDTRMSRNMQTICPNRDDSFSLPTYDRIKFQPLIFFKPQNNHNNKVDSYWKLVCWGRTSISHLKVK